MPPPRRPELLLPAGSLPMLKTAFLYGADAVYAGTPDLSLRTQSRFSFDALAEGIAFAHARDKRVYLTLNLFARNADIERLESTLKVIRAMAPDGLIVADPGIFQLFRDKAPELDLHISTQANVMSWLAVEYWHRQGASRCVLAREVSFAELREIRQRCPNAQLEAFVHGSMCMTHSGRCLLSNFMAGRGANQGNCAHSCRWKYKVKVEPRGQLAQQLEISEANREDYQFYLEEEFRSDELFPIEEDARGAYVLSSKDLCLMPRLAEFLSLGVDSLKVEGRNKNQYYVAVVARAYRAAIDAYFEAPTRFDPQPFVEELATTSSRGFTLGFHDGELSHLAHDYASTQSLSEYQFAGIVRGWENGDLIVELKNRLEVGDWVELLAPVPGQSATIVLDRLENAATGQQMLKIPAGDERAIRIRAESLPAGERAERERRWPPLSVLRKRSTLDGEARERVEIRRQQQAQEAALVPLARRKENARDLLPSKTPIARRSEG